MDRILGMLGLAKKAQKVAVGQDLVLAAIRNNAPMVFLATDASENTVKKFRDKTTFYNVDLVEMYTKEQLGNAVGYQSVSAVALLDVGFSNGIKNKMGDNV